jgi:hypothetical protein
LLLKSLLRNIILMMIVRVATKDNPSSADIYISIQIHLVLKLVHIHTVDTNNISDSKNTGELLYIFCKELKTDVSHGSSSSRSDIRVLLELLLAWQTTYINLFSAFDIKRVIY